MTSRIVEEVTGQDLRGVLDTMLFEPLGLDDTASYPHAPRSGATPEPQAHVWSKDTVLRPQGALRHQVADGGIVSTLADQVRFMRAVVGGQVFDEPATWQRMQRDVNRVFFLVDYGLGVLGGSMSAWVESRPS